MSFTTASKEVSSTDAALPSSLSVLNASIPTLSTPAITTTINSNSSTIISTYGNNDYLPTNVSTMEQLYDLPVECISYVDVNRPLKHVSEDGTTVSTYSLKPLSYSAAYILVVEVLERFSFYSLNYTQTSYLTGQYNPNWNAKMDSIMASSYVSISIAIAHTSPFIGAVLGDIVLGDYCTMLFASLCLYWPGLVLIASTTLPLHIFTYHQHTFNHTALSIGLLLLFPVGSGIVESVVNIFGAKQFHPLLQSSLIEAYYVNFYMCINFGALLGGIIVPTIASQKSVTIAYVLPVCLMFIGICIFVSGTSRYVLNKPKGTRIFSSIFCSWQKTAKKKKQNKTNLSSETKKMR